MRRIGSAVLGLSLAGFSLLAGAAVGQVASAPKAVLGDWGVDLSGMDKSVKPGDDFFRYVNGAWFATAEIPPDRTTTGSFVQLDIQSETRVRGILSELEMRRRQSLRRREAGSRPLHVLCRHRPAGAPGPRARKARSRHHRERQNA